MEEVETLDSLNHYLVTTVSEPDVIIRKAADWCRAAVSAERKAMEERDIPEAIDIAIERCAKICDDMAKEKEVVCPEECAAAIRCSAPAPDPSADEER